MEDFYFEAADFLGRKISGTIKAESNEEARKKLKSHDLAVFLVKIKTKEEEQEIKTNKDGVPFKRYEFEAKDENGKIVHGVINALDEGNAYKSLKIEYDFDALYLVESTLPEKEKLFKKEKGIDDGLKNWLEAELKYSSYYKKKKIEMEKKLKRKEIINFSPSEQKKLEWNRNRIEEIISAVSVLLKKYEEYLDKNKKREIEDRLNLLSRLRQSNALEHLKSLVNKLIKKLSDDTIFLTEIDQEISSLEEMDKAKLKFKYFAEDFKKKMKTEPSNLSIKVDLEAIDPLVITKKISKINLIKRFGTLLYNIFFFLFLFFLFFWIFISIQNIVSKDPEIIQQTLFYFDSIQLWGITFFSAMILFGFAPIVFGYKFLKGPSIKKQKNKYLLLVFLGIFLLFFHVHSIFIWAS